MIHYGCVSLCVDADGDMIAFSSDDELMEAVKSVSDGIFRVFIVEKKTHRNENQPFADQADLLHPGVTCDGCSGEVRGIRYKCTVCTDYDLCSRCKLTGLHGEHEMTAIERPQMPVSYIAQYIV
jgi:sequestosome 1